MLLEVAKKLRLEQEREKSIQDKIRDQMYQIDQNEVKRDKLEKQLKLVQVGNNFVFIYNCFYL